MNISLQLDDLDIQIIKILLKDCRTSYLEIARLCNVSGSTVHVRMKKIEELGLIKGSKLLVNYSLLGYDICCFICLKIDNPYYYNSVLEQVKSIKEVVELYFTVGDFSILMKVICKNIETLNNLVTNELSSLEGVSNFTISVSTSQQISREINFD